MAGEGGVTGSSRAAVATAEGVLLGGGNAADAAVAAALAACVAEPGACGIGGSGGEAVVDAGREGVWSVSFRQTAPGGMPSKALTGPHPADGPLASLPPRVVAGLARLLEAFGTISWSSALRPAVALAREGFRLDPTQEIAFAALPETPALAAVFAIEDDAAGRLYRMPALAETLQHLADFGPLWMYEGSPAEDATAAFAAAKAHVGRDDWQSAPHSIAVERAPALDIGGASVFTTSLATTGAPCLLAFLSAMNEAARVDDLEASPAMVTMARMMASVWQYRLTTPAGNDARPESLFEWIDTAIGFGPDVVPLPRDRGHTTHINVIDPDGMAVALTLTLGQRWFGARWALGDTGIIMNDGMHLFEGARPVVRQGTIIPINDMAPAIARHGNGAHIAIGSPGGRHIPARVALALGRRLFGGMDAAAAIAAPRLHAERLGAVTVERERMDSEVLHDLAQAIPEIEDARDDMLAGPLTAIERDRNGRVGLGLDDRRTRGFGRVVG